LGAGAGAGNQLRAHGYEVIPEVIENESGIWETFFQVRRIPSPFYS
jgi:hypothetical protein